MIEIKKQPPPWIVNLRKRRNEDCLRKTQELHISKDSSHLDPNLDATADNIFPLTPIEDIDIIDITPNNHAAVYNSQKTLKH